MGLVRRYRLVNPSRIKKCVWCNMPKPLFEFSRDIRFIDQISIVCDECKEKSDRILEIRAIQYAKENRIDPKKANLIKIKNKLKRK